MGPLVYYCRWRNARLRLRGRDERAVWGQLAFVAETGNETVQEFRFDLQSWELSLAQPEGWERLQLDELGVVVKTSADDAPR